MEQTNMNKNMKKNENIKFNVNFVNQPFFEILGNSDKKYNVEFFVKYCMCQTMLKKSNNVEI